MDFPGGPRGKESLANVRDVREMQVQSLGEEGPLEEGTATDSCHMPGDSLGWRSLVGHSP